MNSRLLSLLLPALLLGACPADGAADGADQDGSVSGPTTGKPPRNFSWVSDKSLAGMAHPGYGESARPAMEYLTSNGIHLLVSLTQTPVDQALLGELDIKGYHLPVKDFTAPAIEQLEAFVTIADEAMGRGMAVGVHCGAGKGRTGTFLAAWFIAREGMSASQAIAEIRKLRPGSIETATQEEVLHRFATLRGKTE